MGNPNMPEKLLLPEEILQRINTKQNTGQFLSIFKIAEKAQKKLLENDDPDQVAELEWLWSECTGEDLVVSDACCQALLSLVLQGSLDATAALAGLTLRLQSAKSLDSLVAIITDLLELDMKTKLQSEGKYTCLFNLKTPLHPYISVLKQRPDAWHCLYKNTYLHLNDQEFGDYWLDLLRPFFLYCLCDPTCPDNISSLRTLLWQLLMSLHQKKAGVLSLILEVLSWIQVNGGKNAVQAEQVFQDLLRYLIANPTVDQNLIDSVCACAISTCVDVLSANFVPVQMLQLLNKLLSVIDNGKPLIFIFLVDFLKRCPKSCLKEALQMCIGLMSSGKVNPYLQFCLFPVCLRISNLDCLFMNEEKKMCLEILESLSGLDFSVAAETTPITSWIRSELRQFHGSFSKIQELITLSDELQKGEKGINLAKEWGETLKNRKESIGRHELLMLESLFLCPTVDSTVILTCLRALIEGAKLDACCALDLFPLLLYKLGQEWQPEVKLEILYEMTELSSHKLLVGPVLRVIQLLPRSPSLKPLAIRIMAKMHTRQPRAFPFLEKLLQEDGSGTGVTKHQGMSEFMVAKAATIIEICQSNAGLHGASLLSPLSQILNTCSGPDGSVPCSMALDGIMTLCEAEVIDIRTTWRVISPKLAKDKRPRVLAKFCEMMSMIGKRRVANTQYEKLVGEVLVLLWKMTSFSHDMVSSAAFRALASFKIESSTLAMLPPVAKEGLKVPDALITTPLEAAKKPEELLKYIPGECFIKMLKHPEDGSLEAYGTLLATAVRQEVEQLPNSVYAMAYQRSKAAAGVEPETYAYLDERSVLKPVAEYIRNIPKSGQPSPRHLGELLAVLSSVAQELPRALPALNWDALLTPLLRLGSSVQLSCLKVLLNQGIDHQGKGSVSAKKLLERCFSIDPPIQLTWKQIEWAFDSLGLVGRVIPPQSLTPFLNAKLDASLSCPRRTITLLEGLSRSLKDTRMHENNRVAVASIIETMIDRLDPNQEEVFNCYLNCISELPTKNLMRMTSPTMWWQVEDEKLRRAARVCAHLVTCEDNQLMWLNEIIDVASTNQCDKSGVLREIVRAVSSYHNSENQKLWLMDLIGQIRRNARDLSKTQSTESTEKVTFLLDTLCLAILCWSRALPLERSLQWSRDQRLLLLPSCVAYLLTLPSWEDKAPQVLEWSLGVVVDGGLPPLYEACFKTSLRAMKSWPCYGNGTQWAKAISIHV